MGGRRHDPIDDNAIGLVELDAEDDEDALPLPALALAQPAPRTGLSFKAVATLFLCSSAASGACAIAFGLFPVAPR